MGWLALAKVPCQFLDEIDVQVESRAMVLGYYSAMMLVTVVSGVGPQFLEEGQRPGRITLEHVKRIVLDPGHGGNNNGCLGVDGTYEKTVVLALAKRIEAILRKETNAVPLLTRRSDKPLGLADRSRMANEWKADVFLSLHLNADQFGSGFGVETWFLGADAADAEAQKLVEQEEATYREHSPELGTSDDLVSRILRDAQLRLAQAQSEALAVEVAKGMHNTTKRKLRGVKQAPFGVLKAAKMPAIVVEAGFFTHKEEGWVLLTPEHQERIARGIVAGIVAFDRQIGGKEPTVTQSD